MKELLFSSFDSKHYEHEVDRFFYSDETYRCHHWPEDRYFKWKPSEGFELYFCSDGPHGMWTRWTHESDERILVSLIVSALAEKAFLT